MTLSETVGEGIISVAICGGSFHSLPGLLAYITSPVNTRHRPNVFDVGPTLDKCLIQMFCVCWELDYVTIANS